MSTDALIPDLKHTTKLGAVQVRLSHFAAKANARMGSHVMGPGAYCVVYRAFGLFCTVCVSGQLHTCTPAHLHTCTPAHPRP
eukprot:121867-Rhodomonas_salina.1